MSRYDKSEVYQDLSPEAIQGEVERILASEKFARSKRLRSLLRFTVAQTLQGNADTLKEYVIGTEVLKKPDSYDPRSDSLVRVLASRLRVKLKEYYNDGGSEDPLVIEFPKGKYVPRFQRREQLQTEIEKKLRARNACSQGRFLMTRLGESTLSEAALRFEEAIEADPVWPAAHEGLASVYAFQAFFGFRKPREAWPLARTQAETTLQLDEMSADAHIYLGMVCAFYEWRWRDAESHFQKALERDSYSGAGRLWRALACLLPQARIGEAQQELAKARELASAPLLEEGQALVFYFSERYQEALAKLEMADSASLPFFVVRLRARILAALGRTSEGIAMLENVRGQEPARMPIALDLAYLHGIAGETEKAREMLAGLRERRSAGSWVSNYELAAIEMALDNRNEALTLLHEALREKEPVMAFLAVDPRFHAIRNTPKFSSLLRRIMLTDGEESRVQGA
jgi:tetratricopeptide (TPR) repeat protein